jgi:hypothetical protein
VCSGTEILYIAILHIATKMEHKGKNNILFSRIQISNCYRNGNICDW